MPRADDDLQLPLRAGKATLQNGAATTLPEMPLRNGLLLKASAGNTVEVMLGGMDGYPLAPGEAVSLTVGNAAAVTVQASETATVFYLSN